MSDQDYDAGYEEGWARGRDQTRDELAFDMKKLTAERDAALELLGRMARAAERNELALRFIAQNYEKECAAIAAEALRDTPSERPLDDGEPALNNEMDDAVRERQDIAGAFSPASE